jgi:selenocysteine insertion sequence-binding protein 2
MYSYCNHLVKDEINTCAEHFLADLARFQDRMYLKDPIKAKAKRRYVCGLREVLKHLKLRKLKCIILPPNLDRIQSEGWLVMVNKFTILNCKLVLQVVLMI